MKITRRQLRQIIRSEINQTLLKESVISKSSSPCVPYTILQAVSDTENGLEYIKQYEKPTTDDDEECSAGIERDLKNYWKLKRRTRRRVKKALRRLIVNRDKSRGSNSVVVIDPKTGNKDLNHDNFKQWAKTISLAELKEK